MQHRRPILNEYELATEGALSRSAEREGGRVLPMVRLADAIDVNAAGLDRAERRYALQAHLDMVVVDQSQVVQFAVEYDGAAHDSDPEQIARDRLKDAICERAGLQLFRIDSSGLQRAGKRRLVEWLADVWFYAQAFEAAQSEGTVAADEPFTYWSAFDVDASGRWRPAFALDSEARIAMKREFDAGRAPRPAPEEATTPYAADPGFVEAWCVFAAAEDAFVAGHARIRSFRPFAGVGPRDVALDLAVMQAGFRLVEFREGRTPPLPRSWVRDYRRRTSGWERQGLALPAVPE